MQLLVWKCIEILFTVHRFSENHTPFYESGSVLILGLRIEWKPLSLVHYGKPKAMTLWLCITIIDSWISTTILSIKELWYLWLIMVIYNSGTDICNWIMNIYIFHVRAWLWIAIIQLWVSMIRMSIIAHIWISMILGVCDVYSCMGIHY